jgi:hypothetical protein
MAIAVATRPLQVLLDLRQLRLDVLARVEWPVIRPRQIEDQLSVTDLGRRRIVRAGRRHEVEDLAVALERHVHAHHRARDECRLGRVTNRARRPFVADVDLDGLGLVSPPVVSLQLRCLDRIGLSKCRGPSLDVSLEYVLVRCAEDLVVQGDVVAV